MKKYIIISAGLCNAIALVVTMTASAQVSATAGTNVIGRILPADISSTTIRARLEARFSSSTPRMRDMSSTTRMENQQQRITAIQGRSDTEITQRIDSLNQILSRINAMVNISASDKTSLSSSLQTEIADLTSLKNSIDTDTSTTSLKTDFQSITKSYRVYMLVLPQASITAAADRVLDLVSDFNTLSAKLQGYITTAQSNGVDVSSAVSAMTDITAKVTDAGTQANAAISEITGLQPDQGATTTIQANTATLKDAQSKIKAATADLTAARKDVTTIVSVIKGSMKFSTGVPTSTKAQ